MESVTMMVHTARCLIESYGQRKGAPVLGGRDALGWPVAAWIRRYVGGLLEKPALSGPRTIEAIKVGQADPIA